MTLDEILITCDPKYSQKVEIVNSLFDALLPDIVTLLTPLTEKIVKVCRENNITSATTEGDNGDNDNDEFNSHSSSQLNEFFGNSDESDGGYAQDW